jgi:hypothetical protein
VSNEKLMAYKNSDHGPWASLFYRKRENRNLLLTYIKGNRSRL